MNKITVFVVGLQKAVNRKKFMELQLKNLPSDFDVRWFDAIDGQKLSCNYIKENFDENKSYEIYQRKLLIGEIGCALSHKEIYRIISNEKIPCAVILEDDVLIKDNFIKQVRILANCIEYTSSNIVLLTKTVSLKAFFPKKINNSFYLSKVIRATCTAGYFITQSAANNLLLFQSPVCRVADCWFDVISKKICQIFVVNDPSVDSRSLIGFSSFIDESNVNRGGYKQTIFRKLKNKVFELCAKLIT